MAIINNNYQFVYVHIPKCAGTTVTSVLGQLSTMFDLEIGGTEYGEAFQRLFISRFNIYKHSKAWEIRNQIGRERWVKSFNFTFVRNPYDRAYSTYKYLLAHNREIKFLEEGQGFSDFILTDKWRGQGPFSVLRPQSVWVASGADAQDSILDKIAKVEDMKAELTQIMKTIGVPEGKIAAMDFGSKNVSPEPKDKPSLTGKALERMRERYQHDFSMFGYDPDDVPFDVQ